MTAKLTLELDNRTGKGFAEVVKDLNRLGQQADRAGSAISDLNAELQSTAAEDMASQIEDLAGACDGFGDAGGNLLGLLEQINDSFDMGAGAAEGYEDTIINLLSTMDDAETGIATLSDGFGDLEGAAEDSDDAAGESGKGWSTLIDIFGNLQSGCYGFQDALSLVNDYVVKSAKEGNQAFQSFLDAGDKLVTMLDDLAQSEGATHMVQKLSEGIEVLIPWIEAYYKNWLEGFRLLESGWRQVVRSAMSAAEALGVVAKGTVDTLDKMQKAEEEAEKKRSAQREKERQEKKRALTEAAAADKRSREQDLNDPTAKIRAQFQRQQHLTTISQINEESVAQQLINDKLRRRQELIASVSKAGKDPLKEKTLLENEQELELLEERRLQLTQERVRIRDDEKSAKDTQCDCEGTQQWVQEVQKKAQANTKDNKSVSVNDPSEAGQMSASESNTLAAKIRSGAQSNKGNIAKQLIKRREDAAVAAWRKDLTDKKLMNNWGKLKRGGTQYEENKVRSKARAKAKFDIQRGKVDGQETQQAISDLTNNTVDMLRHSGALDTKAVNTLEQLAREANQRAEKTAQLQDQLDRINDSLQRLTGRGMSSNQRAQNASSAQW